MRVKRDRFASGTVEVKGIVDESPRPSEVGPVVAPADKRLSPPEEQSA
jgi:hypothetical protein